MPGMSSGHGSEREPGPYVELDRSSWAALATANEQPLSAAEIERVRGLGDELDLDEVQQVYLPLSRLLSMYVESAGALHRAQEDFLHQPVPPRTPFVIGLAPTVRAVRHPAAVIRRRFCSPNDAVKHTVVSRPL